MGVCSCQEFKGYTSLSIGDIVKVYIENSDGGHVFEGMAKLLKPLRTWYCPEPFPITESCKKCYKTTNNIKVKWLVEFIPDDILSGSRVTSRNIHLFHSYGIPHIRDEFDRQN